MSDPLPLPTEPPIESTPAAASASSTTSIALAGDHSTSAPALALPPAPTDVRALLDLITAALGSDADPATRAGAREAWAQLAQPLAIAIASPPAAPAAPPPPAPLAPMMPVLPNVPAPSSPLVVAARALRGLPPEQLLDIVLQRLRAALPTGTAVAAPKGIQFQLVPVTQQPTSR